MTGRAEDGKNLGQSLGRGAGGGRFGSLLIGGSAQDANGFRIRAHGSAVLAEDVPVATIFRKSYLTSETGTITVLEEGLTARGMPPGRNPFWWAARAWHKS